MTVAALLAIAITGVLLVVLGARDPKRLRNSRHGRADARPAPPFRSAVRYTLGWLCLSPGLVLAVLGEWWAFLVWLGAITAIGWTIAITAGYSTAAVSHRNRS